MKLKTLFLLLPILVFFSCEKDNGSKDATPCEIKMKSHFKDKLKCSKKGEMEVNLYSGEYEGKTVYFTDTMCIACLTIAPKEGYTCDMEKIEFKDFQDVKEIKQVYNSCSKSYVN